MYILTQFIIDTLKKVQNNPSKNKQVLDEILSTQQELLQALNNIKHPLALQTIGFQLVLAAQHEGTNAIFKDIESMSEEINPALELYLKECKEFLLRIKETDFILSNNL